MGLPTGGAAPWLKPSALADLAKRHGLDAEYVQRAAQLYRDDIRGPELVTAIERYPWKDPLGWWKPLGRPAAARLEDDLGRLWAAHRG